MAPDRAPTLPPRSGGCRLLDGVSIRGGARPRDVACLALLLGLGAALAAGVPTVVALGALALGAGAAVLSPAAALAAVVVALPLAFRPVAIGNLAFSPLELAILLAAVGVGGEMRRSLPTVAGQVRWRRLAVPLAITAPALALLAVATLSLATVAEPAYRHESLREYRLVIVEPLLGFFAARWLLRDAPSRRLVIAALLATGTIVAAGALVQVATRSGGVIADGAYRPRATYPHPNNLAFFLERVGSFAAGMTVARLRDAAPGQGMPGRPLGGAPHPRNGPDSSPAPRRPRSSRQGGNVSPQRWPAGRRTGAANAVLLAVTVVILAGGVVTASRGLLLALAAGSAVIVSLVGTRRWWRWYGAGLVVALVGFGLVAGPRLADVGGAGTAPTRLLVWRASLRMALDHPLFGVGLDQFLYQYWPRYVEPAGWPERYTAHPHNFALDLWLRLGILGAAVFGWLAAAVGRLVARLRMWARQGAPGAQHPAIGATAALAAGLVHGLVDNGFFLPDLAVMTWLFIALLETAAAPADKTARPNRGD